MCLLLILLGKHELRNSGFDSSAVTPDIVEVYNLTLCRNAFHHRSSVFTSRLTSFEMFSSTLRATLIALAASAVAVSAAPGLSLKVSGAEAVDGVQNLKVSTTITNTGDETLKLINDPRGVLNTLPSNSCAISTDSGASPSFVGAKVKYALDKAAKNEDDSAFTVLAPGSSFTVTHDCKWLRLTRMR